jgi:ABC-2 type transport system permease protein
MKSILILVKKELKDYFISPIAYIVIITFLLAVSIWFVFIKGLFVSNQADMRDIFIFITQIFIIVIPALTMRSWAEERKSQTLEILTTLPISSIELIISKFLSCLIFVVFALILTFPIPLTLNILGNPDNGIILAGYIGLIFLSACYIIIGQFISINTNNQIVAFIASSVIILILYIFGEAQFLQYFPNSIRVIFESFGIGSHFLSIAKGVIDTRDILYYLSLILIMFYFIYKSFDKIKRGK